MRENLTVFACLYGLRHCASASRRGATTSISKRCSAARASACRSGQKTRMALAKALINEPELLLLDEPTASLDPDIGDWVRRILADYARRSGAAILLASHNMARSSGCAPSC